MIGLGGATTREERRGAGYSDWESSVPDTDIWTSSEQSSGGGERDDVENKLRLRCFLAG